MSRTRRDSDRASVTSIVEPLERRQLLSASVTGAFLGSIPSELLGGKLNNRVTVRVSNTSGAREAGKVSVGLYVSTTPDLQGDAVLVGTASRNLRMRAGQAANFPFHFASPSALPDGSDYLVAKIGGPGGIGGAGSESIIVASQPVSAVHPFIDLTGQATGPSSPITETGVRAARAWMRVSVTNIGSSPTRGPMQLAADMSLKTTFDGSATGIGSVSFPAVTIKPGATRTFRVPLTIPAGTPGGGYTLFANINPARRIAESDYANDIVTASGVLVIFSPTTTLGAGGGIGGYVSGGGGSNTSSNPPAVRIINGGGGRPVIRVTNPGNGTGSTPPYIGGGGGGGGGTTTGGDDSGGDAPDPGASCGGDDSGGSDPGSDSGANDPTEGGAASDPTDPGGDPNAGGDNGSDFGNDPGTDPGTDPGAGTDFGSTDGGTDSGGTDWGSDPGTDSGSDSGNDSGGDDSSGSDFGSDDSTDSGGYADFAVRTFQRTAAAKTSRATQPAPIAFRRIR